MGEIYLRPITDEDTELVVKWRNNPRVQSNFIFRETFTPELHRNWLRTRVEGKRDVVQWIIVERMEGSTEERPIGSVYFRDIDREEMSAEYGVFIGEDDAVGHGYGKEAARLALAAAERGLGLKRVILRVFADNAVAMHTYEYVGFHVTESLPAVECSDGTHRDMLLMERTF